MTSQRLIRNEAPVGQSDESLVCSPKHCMLYILEHFTWNSVIHEAAWDETYLKKLHRHLFPLHSESGHWFWRLRARNLQKVGSYFISQRQHSSHATIRAAAWICNPTCDEVAEGSPGLIGRLGECSMIEPVNACKQFPLMGNGSCYMLLLFFVRGIKQVYREQMKLFKDAPWDYQLLV